MRVGGLGGRVLDEVELVVILLLGVGGFFLLWRVSDVGRLGLREHLF